MSRRPIVVGIGEILWDLFPDGARFGGAPANFACSASGIGLGGFEVCMVSAVGADDLGDRAIGSLVEHGVCVNAVARIRGNTGQVHVKLDGHGHASYAFESDAAWDRLEWTMDLAQLAKRTDVVCFGTLGQRSDVARNTIRSFVSTTPPKALRIFDVNVRRPFINEEVILESLKLANILKLNEEELPVLASLLGLTGTPLAMIRQLATRFPFQVVALTRGAQGAMLIRGDEISEEPCVDVGVVDTVGAGDAFTAALAIGLSQGLDLQSINRRACLVAAFVCTQSGATPKLPDRLL
jgi:fructokinase